MERGYPVNKPIIRRVEITSHGQTHLIVAPFEVRNATPTPGYLVYGQIGGSFPGHIAVALHPHSAPQPWPKHNGWVRPGWRTKREAIEAMKAHCYS